ncbi:MAG: hypothetical protein OXE51_03240 [Gammaproteobacteria bacterium]|nr:hypothetical protein [Gammaproteobacteria bacterium]
MKLIKVCLLSAACLLASAAHAQNCPPEAPHPLEDGGCDICDWEELARQYEAGELSVTRPSLLFDHRIKVTRFCESDTQKVDMDDVFNEIHKTERVFDSMFGNFIRTSNLAEEREARPWLDFGFRTAPDDSGDSDEPGDSDEQEQPEAPRILEMVVGVCEVENQPESVPAGCAVIRGFRGSAYPRTLGNASRAGWDDNKNHVAVTGFVPNFPGPDGSERAVWTESNQYYALQHEHAHLLDFEYIRRAADPGGIFPDNAHTTDGLRGADFGWWIEGLPTYVQWQVLRDYETWLRGGSGSLINILTNDLGADIYHDGMRVFAYLHRRNPAALEHAAHILFNDYREPILKKSGQVGFDHAKHLQWRRFLIEIAERHEDSYQQWTEDVYRYFQFAPDSVNRSGYPDERIKPMNPILPPISEGKRFDR